MRIHNNLFRFKRYDFKIQIYFKDGVIKEHYDEQQASAIELGVVSNITTTELFDSEGDSCPNWIAAEFNQFGFI